MRNPLNGAKVIAHDLSTGTTYLRLPPESQTPTNGCSCTFCKAHPTETPMWDTLAIPKDGTAWTVHMPDPQNFIDGLARQRK